MISHFRYEYHFLSNFYLDPVDFDGRIWKSVEHAYAAAKTLDPIEKQKIADTELPGQAKKLGRKVTMRPDWDSIKLDIMRRLIGRKFHPGTELSVSLIQTHPHELVEGNWWGDTYWGVSRGKGENWLGKILMEQRDYLIKEVGKVGGHSD